MENKIKGIAYVKDVRDVQLPYKRVKALLNNTDIDDENFRNLFSIMLHKPVETINEYLLHSEYLEDSILDDLVESEINKRLFEEIQKIIGRIKIDCRDDGLSDPEIANNVSKAVTEMLNEYRETGRINFSEWKTDWQKFTLFQNGERRSKRLKGKRRKQPHFQYHPGAKYPSEYQPVTIDKTSKVLEAIVRRLNNLPASSDANLKSTARKLKKEIVELAKIQDNYLELIKNKSLNPKKDL